MQAAQQAEGDPLCKRGLVLLGLPIELERAYGAEIGEGRVEEDQVDVVAQVDPDEDEEAEVGSDDGGVEVIECFGGLTKSFSKRVRWGFGKEDLQL